MADARSLASNGSVSTRVFLDSNQDGIFNGDDEPISGIGFRVGGGFNAERSDEDGIVFLTGLSAHQPLSITINSEHRTLALKINCSVLFYQH